MLIKATTQYERKQNHCVAESAYGIRIGRDSSKKATDSHMVADDQIDPGPTNRSPGLALAPPTLPSPAHGGSTSAPADDGTAHGGLSAPVADALHGGRLSGPEHDLETATTHGRHSMAPATLEMSPSSTTIGAERCRR